jgi:hypothetical protein
VGAGRVGKSSRPAIGTGRRGGQAIGLRTTALRFYERKGVLRPANRIGGRRCYDIATLRWLAVISTRAAERYGVTVRPARVDTVVANLFSATGLHIFGRWKD